MSRDVTRRGLVDRDRPAGSMDRVPRPPGPGTTVRVAPSPLDRLTPAHTANKPYDFPHPISVRKTRRFSHAT